MTSTGGTGPSVPADGPPPTADSTASRPPVLFTARPRRVTIYAGIASALVVGVTVYVSVTLRRADTGVIFRTSDAVAVMLLGVLFAGGLMLVGRPRLRISADGMRVRNIFGERFVPWALVRRLAFPEGSNWAQLEMADDELMPVMAIQAIDRQRAVTALRTARALIEKYAPPLPPVREYRMPDPVRPLGRREQIDRMKAAQGKKPRPTP